MAEKVLIVSYYFPPLGMGGVQRMSKLVKYLPEYGYSPVVLTVKPILYPAYDYSLLSELPESATIYRSGSYDPSRFARLLRTTIAGNERVRQQARKSVNVWPDTKIGWKGPALRLGKKIIRKERPRAIISSSPPITAHMVAMTLAGEHDLPWIADFRDFWEPQPPEELFEDPALHERSLKLLDEIADTAFRITTVVDDITRRYPSRSETIMGGFDPEDFADLESSEERQNGRLCYMGTVSDLAPMEIFFAAARRAANRNTDMQERLSFRFIGHNDRELLEGLARTYGFGDRLEIVGYREHREALRLAAGSSMMLISTRKNDPHIITSKIFDCLALPVPILAAAPSGGALERLIEFCNAGYCVDSENEVLLAERMEELFEEGKRGESRQKINIGEFTRQAVASRFSTILNRSLHV
jgi:glycosyltransferase involved in cell wall biosynthesis